MGRKLSTVIFIAKARLTHGDRYRYTRTHYYNMRTHVTITCTIHGPFRQLPRAHIRGSGCPECAGNVKCNRAKFIEKSVRVHGEKYDYSKVEYYNNYTHVIIICPNHGEFSKMPYNHTMGQGCPKCGRLGL
jgi:hypothetical protein